MLEGILVKVVHFVRRNMLDPIIFSSIDISEYIILFKIFSSFFLDRICLSTHEIRINSWAYGM